MTGQVGGSVGVLLLLIIAAGVLFVKLKRRQVYIKGIKGRHSTIKGTYFGGKRWPILAVLKSNSNCLFFVPDENYDKLQ